MQLRKKPAHNKPIAYMAADVIIQASVPRTNIGYYPQCSLLETATNAIAKTLRCHHYAMASQRARGFATLSGSIAYATAPNN